VVCFTELIDSVDLGLIVLLRNIVVFITAWSSRASYTCIFIASVHLGPAYSQLYDYTLINKMWV
jgi:hypothetical protein